MLFSAVIVIKDGAKQQQVCSHLSNSTPFSLCASATFFPGRVRRLVPVVGFFCLCCRSFAVVFTRSVALIVLTDHWARMSFFPFHFLLNRFCPLLNWWCQLYWLVVIISTERTGVRASLRNTTIHPSFSHSLSLPPPQTTFCCAPLITQLTMLLLLLL